MLGLMARGQKLQRFIRAIDDRLREQGVPIPDLPDAAVRVAEERAAPEIRANIAAALHADDPVGGGDLEAGIRRWCEEHYSGALGPAVRIESESEFLQYIEEIDQKLRDQGTLIPGRPLMALHDFCTLVKEELRLPPPRDPVPGRYTGDDLALHIDRWYRDRYGDKINVENKTGRVVVLLRGDPWVLELPLIYEGGRLNYFCEYGRPTTLPNEPVVYRRGEPPPPPSDYNVLDALVGLPDGLARSLTKEECDRVLLAFLWGREGFELLWRPRRGGLVALAHSDLKAAVVSISGNDRHPGPSKWASLQATEKLLKAYIRDKGAPFEFTHKLSDLVKEAVKQGLPSMDSALIEAIQCPAGVRYGEPEVSLPEAVAAHHASLRIVAHVLPHVSPPPKATKLAERSKPRRTGAPWQDRGGYAERANRITATSAGGGGSDSRFSGLKIRWGDGIVLKRFLRKLWDADPNGVHMPKSGSERLVRSGAGEDRSRRRECRHPAVIAGRPGSSDRECWDLAAPPLVRSRPGRDPAEDAARPSAREAHAGARRTSLSRATEPSSWAPRRADGSARQQARFTTGSAACGDPRPRGSGDRAAIV